MTEPSSPARPSPPPYRAAEKWCPARMADFLRALAAGHSVAEAARSVGMSRQSAYRLRARLKGEPFDIAWEAAFQHGYDALAEAALERAIHGVEVPVFHKGEQVGAYRRFDERLTCFLLARRNAVGAQQLGRYTAAAEFWSERWDRMLDRVEHGPALWTYEDGAPAVPADTEAQDRSDEDAARLLEKRHALDAGLPPPRHAW